MRFDEQVDLCLQNKDDIYSDLMVCETPQCLIDLGCKPLPMLYQRKHCQDAVKSKDPKGILHTHGLKVEQIKSLPDLIADPVMVYKIHGKQNDIAIVTSEVDDDKMPITVFVCLDGIGKKDAKNISSNFIKSVYGRRTAQLDHHLQTAVSNCELLYVDYKKSQELFSVIGTHLTSRFNNLDYNKIIRLDGASVNKNTLKIQKNIKKMEKIEVSLSDLKKDKELLKMKYEKQLPQFSEKVKHKEGEEL